MYNYLRLPQTRSPESSQPGHAPCIPSLLKLCENTVSFCVNIPRNFIKACSQLIECLGNSAVCLSSCQRWFETFDSPPCCHGHRSFSLGSDVSVFFPCRISDSPIQGKPFGCAKVFSWIISNLFSSPSATLNLVINCSSFLVFRHWPLRARTSGWRVMAAFRNEPSFPFPGEKRITDSHPNKSNNQILKYYSKTLPKEKYQKCQVIQLKQLQWASQIWCRRKFAAWVSSRLWTLQKFTTVGSKASSYFILWEAAFMQSLQVKHLLYLDSKSIIEKIRAAWSTWTTPKLSISSECPKRIVQADLHHHPRLDASTVLVQPEKNIFSSSTFVEILWGVSMLTRILLVKNPARESTAWHWSQLIPLKKNHEKAVVIQVHGTRLWSV